MLQVGCAVMVERFIDPYRAAFSRDTVHGVALVAAVGAGLHSAGRRWWWPLMTTDVH